MRAQPDPRRVYQEILANMPEGLERQVFEIFLQEPTGMRVSRSRLIAQCFGYAVNPRTLASSQEDRQIRRAIMNLRMKGIAILSESSARGYYLGNKEDRDKFIAEQVKRMKSISEMVKAMRRVTLDLQEPML
jgi:hypothetical protein